MTRASLHRAPGRARVLWCLLGSVLLGGFEPPAARAQVPVVPPHSVWKYEASGTDLGTAWRTPGFDDGAWPSGPGPLGYGDPFISTVVPYGPNAAQKYPTTYFRRSFSWSGDTTEVQALFLRADYDDAYVAYLNGTEIARRNLPAGPVSYGTLAAGGHEAGAYELADALAYRNSLVQGTNVLAVEVHQVALSSSDLAWDGEFLLSTLPALVTRGPYLQRGTPTGLVVRWRTDAPTASRVWIGPAPGELSSMFDDPLQTVEHEVAVAGLSPATEYFYAVGTPDAVLAGGDSEHRFTTPPLPGTALPIRAWILGDSGTANAAAAAVRDGYQSWSSGGSPEVWLMLGDNAYGTGTDAEYQAAVFDMYPEYLRNTVLWPTRGNHDGVRAGPMNDYYDLFTLPTQAEAGGVPSGTEAYYSFDYGNAHFICLDSEGSDRAPGGAMLTWLTADLAATDREWVLAFWHHPPYSEGSHLSDDPFDSGGRLRDMRENALPILEAGGVDVVFCGHSHSYERSFLIDGHYDVSSTFVPAMRVDGGNGKVDGDGPYLKSATAPTPHAGAVYVVAGSSGQTSGGPLSHPVMVSSLNALGSVVVDVTGHRLEARFLDDDGMELDRFTMLKGAGTSVAEPGPASGPFLSPGAPNPAHAGTRWSFRLPHPGNVRFRVVDATGRHVRTLVEAPLPPGEHLAAWDGRDGAGNHVAAGVYFSVLEFEGEVRTRKTVVAQ